MNYAVPKPATQVVEPARFRTDINGLRAWAVVAVVLYHFGVSGFGGGFVGVDVFFVISGFLMTGIVVRGLEKGSFSIFNFYMARARRILPALGALCAVLLPLGWFFLLPPDYRTLATHSLYSLAFASNIEYWLEAGYFDVASHEKWLLHTWSLSVEWQFYLILPLVLWAVWRFKPGRVGQIWVLGIAFLASFSASVVTTASDPSAAFYLLHTRAWEMLLGGLVFLMPVTNSLLLRQQRMLEIVGLTLIIFSILFFDKLTVWPGWLAAVPVAGAALVLAANRASVWTGNRYAQWLGDRSYSLYLWHWPVYVGLVYLNLRDDPLVTFAGLCIAVVLGHLSYQLVERPMRTALSVQPNWRTTGWLALMVGSVALPVLFIWTQGGVPGRFPANIELAAAESNNANPRRKECHQIPGEKPPSCIYGGADMRVIVAGDSHADALVSSVAAARLDADIGVMQWTYGACPIIFGQKKTPLRQKLLGGTKYVCSEFLTWFESNIVKQEKNVSLILIGRYAQPALGQNEDLLPFERPEVFFSKVYEKVSPEFLKEVSEKITHTACVLAKQRTVYMVRPTPEMGVDVPRTLSRQMALGLIDDITIPIESYRKRNAWVWAAQDAARDNCGIKILDPTKYLCDDRLCYGSRNGKPYYYDDDHLSESGNKILVPMFEEVFKNLN